MKNFQDRCKRNQKDLTEETIVITADGDPKIKNRFNNNHINKADTRK